MSLDEKLFGSAYRWWRKCWRKWRAPTSIADLPHAASLLEQQASLAIVATLVCGRPIRIRASDGAGSLTPFTQSLPPYLAVFATHHDNTRAYSLRVVLGALWQRTCTGAEVPATELGAFAAALQLLCDELPAAAEELRGLAQQFPESVGHTTAELQRALRNTQEMPQALLQKLRQVFWGRLINAAEDEDLWAQDSAQLERRQGAEFEIHASDEIRRKELKNEDNENPFVHSFEKVHTLEEHHGGSKRSDGSDELAEHQEALRELKMREVVRSNEAAQALLKGDFDFHGTLIEVDEGDRRGGIPYDEWNAATHAYRSGWCRVFPNVHRPGAVSPTLAQAVAQLHASTHPTLAEVERLLGTFALRRRSKSAQLDGSDLDLMACVDRYADLRAGATPPDRLYIAPRPHQVDTAIWILMDASLSMDSWVQGRRLWDTMVQTAWICAETLARREVGFELATFSSHTRRDCRYTSIIRNETWPQQQHALLELVPEGYTRIGPALRHVASLAERHPARTRGVVIVTDGKPNDFDRYEGNYGLADVQRAMLESREQGIQTWGVCVDPTAVLPMTRMFGPSGFSIVDRDSNLAPAVAGALKGYCR